ncbi:stalk domain-containing protein [Paenibacillus jamilae]
MRKRIWTWLLVVSLLLTGIGSSIQPAYAAAASSTVGTMKLYDYSLLEWNGKREFLGRHYVETSTDGLYLGLKPFTDIFGFQADWNKTSKTLTLKNQEHTFVFTANSKQGKVDGAALPLPEAVLFEKGGVAVPLSYGALLNNVKLELVNQLDKVHVAAIPNEDAYSNAYDKVSGPYHQMYSTYEKTLAAYELALNDKLYYVQGYIDQRTPLYVIGSSTAEGNHTLANSSTAGMIIQNPDKSGYSQNGYAGYHYYLRTEKKKNIFGETIDVYVFGAPTAAMQKNITAKKNAYTKADANLRKSNKQFDSVVNNWINAVKKHYKGAGKPNDPNTLAAMAIHLKALYMDTGAYAFDDEAKSVLAVLKKTSESTHWGVRNVFDEGDFRERFQYFLKKDVNVALSIAHTPEQYKAAAEILYNKKNYSVAKLAADEAQALGANMKQMLTELNKLAAEDKEQEQFKAWQQSYVALMKKFEAELAKYNPEKNGEEGASAPQANKEEIDAQFSKPLAKLKTELAALKSVEKNHEEASLTSFEGAIRYLTMNPTDYVAAAALLDAAINFLETKGMK